MLRFLAQVLLLCAQLLPAACALKYIKGRRRIIRKPKPRAYSLPSGVCTFDGQPCLAGVADLATDLVELCCMLAEQCPGRAVHRWNADGNTSAAATEFGCVPDHTNQTLLRQDQYHFKERKRQWRSHFVYVFSVFKEWEHYSETEKKNMKEIVANYKRDFDVVVYNKYRNEADGDAWCQNSYPNLCPDHDLYAPNLGWQMGTYLTFVAEHYDNLPNVTIFVEGDGLDRHTTSFYTPYFLRHDVDFTHVNGAGVNVDAHSTWMRKCFKDSDNFWGSRPNRYMSKYLLELFQVQGQGQGRERSGGAGVNAAGAICFETWCCSQLAVSKALLLRKPQHVWKQAMYHARLGYHDGYEMIMHSIIGGQPAVMPKWTTADWCRRFYRCEDKRSVPQQRGMCDNPNFSEFSCDNGGSPDDPSNGELSPCYGHEALAAEAAERTTPSAK